jgi:predicted nucleic acid-binding protein
MRHHALVLQRLSVLVPSDCAISTVTAYELYTGIEKCANPTKELAKVNLFLATVSELGFDTQAAREAAQIRALLESQGIAVVLAIGMTDRQSHRHASRREWRAARDLILPRGKRK